MSIDGTSINMTNQHQFGSLFDLAQAAEQRSPKNSPSLSPIKPLDSDMTPLQRLETWKDVLFREVPSTEWMAEYLESHGIHLKPDIRLQFKRLFAKEQVIRDGEEWKVTVSPSAKPLTSEDRLASWDGIPRQWVPNKYWMSMLMDEIGLEPARDVNRNFKMNFSVDEVHWHEESGEWQYIGDPTRVVTDEAPSDPEQDENEMKEAESSTAIKAITADRKTPCIESNDKPKKRAWAAHALLEPDDSTSQQPVPKKRGGVEGSTVHTPQMVEKPAPKKINIDKLRRALADKVTKQMKSANASRTHCTCAPVDMVTVRELIGPQASSLTPSKFDESTPVVVATIFGTEVLRKIIGNTKINCREGEFVYISASKQLRFWWTTH